MANLGIAISLAVAFACATLLVMRWWRDRFATSKKPRSRNQYNPYQFADRRPKHEAYFGGTQSQYMVQAAQAAQQLARDWERRKSEGWREVVPGVLVSPDGKTTVEL